MIGRFERFRVRNRPRQAFLPFHDRAQRLERGFKTVVLAFTGMTVALVLGLTPVGRYATALLAVHAKWPVQRSLGWEPRRSEIDAAWRVRRAWGVGTTRARFQLVYEKANPALRTFFDRAGMAPGAGVFRWANYDQVLLFSSAVFDADDRGRSFRLKPGVRSVWLRNDARVKGPFDLLLVPDRPDVRAAGAAAGLVVVSESVQSTNSWGCRGPEPDVDAPVRGLVLGDSFMQGLFIGDDETPPEQLERALRAELGVDVSILNTGHLGYSPEQYYHTLRAYADRFRPGFVVVSVCPNDFGEGRAVLEGKGDWAEAKYWVDAIQRFCRDRSVPCVIAPIPLDVRVEGRRREGDYPGRLSNLFDSDSLSYYNPFDDFVDEHLRLSLDAARSGRPLASSPLYNRPINDGHFSAQGASVWGRALAPRLALLLQAAPYAATLARSEGFILR